MPGTPRMNGDTMLTRSQAQVSCELDGDTVCKLVTAGRLSSGYAAALLGITRRAFFDLLQQQHLPVVDYTEDALAQDLQTLRTLTAAPQDIPVQDPHAH